MSDFITGFCLSCGFLFCVYSCHLDGERELKEISASTECRDGIVWTKKSWDKFWRSTSEVCSNN